MNHASRYLYYNRPATKWNEALPLGNGKLGAMLLGGIDVARIDFNLDTLWSGEGRNKSNPSDKKDWNAIRTAILEEDYKAAEKSLQENILGDWSEAYLPLATLTLGRRKERFGEDLEEYSRVLDLTQSLYKETYIEEGISYEQEAFCSIEDKVFVLKLKASKTILNLKLKLKSPLKGIVEGETQHTLILTGHAPTYVAPNYYHCEDPVVYKEGKGIAYAMGLRVQTTGLVHIEEDTIHIVDADEIVLISTATSDFEQEIGYNPASVVAEQLENISHMPYETLRERHIEAYQHYFNAMQLELGEAKTDRTTDERLRLFEEEGCKDTALITLLFNYGRYLMISSSMPGTLAANLQGIWNSEVRPPWSSNYTLNINTQMNYWPVETTNLSECHIPLIDLIKKLSKTGQKAAKELYGLDGWVSHHNTDPWGMATPVGHYEQNCPPVCYAFWPMSSGWLCRHLWEHYIFNQDEVFLKEEAFPIIKGAVRFYLGYLVPYNDYYVTIPSTSPENTFKDAKGYTYAATIASTMDIAILKELFETYEKICILLDEKDELLEEIKVVKEKLPPYLIGKHGQLQEWLMDFEESDQHHRHVSHLYGLYPGDQITPDHTPELAKACEVTLERRGDAGTGWSLAWKINLWARLKKGERALDCIKKQLTYIGMDGINMGGGGTYANLLCAHPPFQIDGNFGFTSGVCELLMQSHTDVIELLPALPKDWSHGRVKGLKARGGYTLDFKWQNHKVVQVTVRSLKEGSCTLRINGELHTLECQAGTTTIINL